MTKPTTHATRRASTTPEPKGGTVRPHASANDTGRSTAKPGADTIPAVGLEWEYVKRLRRPRAKNAAAGAWHKLIRRDRRKELGIYIQYRGGSEAWWQLRGRGVTVRVPGWMSVHEALDHFTGTI